MRRHPPRLIELSKEDRRELERRVGNGRTEQRVARRARVLLAMGNESTEVQELANRAEMSSGGIWRLCRRAGLCAGHGLASWPYVDPRESPEAVRYLLALRRWPVALPFSGAVCFLMSLNFKEVIK